MLSVCDEHWVYGFVGGETYPIGDSSKRCTTCSCASRGGKLTDWIRTQLNDIGIFYARMKMNRIHNLLLTTNCFASFRSCQLSQRCVSSLLENFYKFNLRLTSVAYVVLACNSTFLSANLWCKRRRRANTWKHGRAIYIVRCMRCVEHIKYVTKRHWTRAEKSYRL